MQCVLRKYCGVSYFFVISSYLKTKTIEIKNDVNRIHPTSLLISSQVIGELSLKSQKCTVITRKTNDRKKLTKKIIIRLLLIFFFILLTVCVCYICRTTIKEQPCRICSNFWYYILVCSPKISDAF